MVCKMDASAKITLLFVVGAMVLLTVLYYIFNYINYQYYFAPAPQLRVASLSTRPEVALLQYVVRHQSAAVTNFEVKEIKHAARRFNLTQPAAIELVGNDIVRYNEHYLNAPVKFYRGQPWYAIFPPQTLQKLTSLNLSSNLDSK